MTNSQNHNDETQGKQIKRYAVSAAKALGVIMLLAVLVHISWNMFAPNMFGFEPIKMKQALGLVVFSSVLAFIFSHRFRRQTRAPVI